MSRTSLEGSIPHPYSRVMVGHLTPDLRLDSLCVGSNEAGVIDGVDSHGSVVRLTTLGSTLIDIVIVEGIGVHAPDALVALTRDGASGATTLERLDYELDHETGKAAFASTVLAAPGWANVTRLATGDLDGNGKREVLGLESRIVHRLELTETSVRESGQTPLLVPADDIRTGPWGAGAADALFAVAADHIQVLDVAGVPLDRVDAFTGQLSDFDTWRGSQGGRMAVVSKEVSTNTSWLQVFGETGYQEPRQTLGITDTVDVVAADFTGNGHPDVGLLNRYDSLLIWLYNSGGPPPGSYVTFSTSDVSRAYAEFFPIAPAVSMSVQSGQAVAADFDGDGDLDMAFACDATRHFHVKRNFLVLETDAMCGSMTVNTLYRDHPLHASPLGGPYSDVGTEADVSLQLPSNAPDYTHVELLLYQTDLGGAPEVALHLVEEISSLGTVLMGPDEHVVFPSVELMGHYEALNDPRTQDEAEYLAIARMVTFSAGVVHTASVETSFAFKHTRNYAVDENGEPGDRPIIGTPSPPTPVGDSGTPPPRRVPPPPQPAGGN